MMQVIRAAWGWLRRAKAPLPDNVVSFDTDPDEPWVVVECEVNGVTEVHCAPRAMFENMATGRIPIRKSDHGMLRKIVAEWLEAVDAYGEEWHG